MVKIRLEGKIDEIEKTVRTLGKSFSILSQSKPYKNRNSVYYRVYLDIEEREQAKRSNQGEP